MNIPQKPTAKPTKPYIFHLKSGKIEEAEGISPADALLWSGYRPHEVAWFEEKKA